MGNRCIHHPPPSIHHRIKRCPGPPTPSHLEKFRYANGNVVGVYQGCTCLAAPYNPSNSALRTVHRVSNCMGCGRQRCFCFVFEIRQIKQSSSTSDGSALRNVGPEQQRNRRRHSYLLQQRPAPGFEQCRRVCKILLHLKSIQTITMCNICRKEAALHCGEQ